MGCCFSNARTQKQNPDDQNGLKNQQPQLRSPVLKSDHGTHEVHPPLPPPSPPVEEESVKEVLTETPISKPQAPILMEERKTHMPIVLHQAEKLETEDPMNKTEEVSEVSQLSEACSMSGSFSTATTAPVTERREDKATSKRSNKEGTQKWNRSASDASRKRPYAVDGNITGGRERRLKSPARRPESSQEKKGQSSSRLVRGRESGQFATRKLNAGSPGKGSGRRSRSPSSTRASNVSAGSGGNQLKPSGGTGSPPPPAKGVEENSKEVGEKNDVVPEESLENPHVSLECFIFL